VENDRRRIEQIPYSVSGKGGWRKGQNIRKTVTASFLGMAMKKPFLKKSK
jgi:hypothetical protein